MQPHLAIVETSQINPLVTKVKSAFQRALLGEGTLPEAVLALSGMSGRKYRLFINNLIGSLMDARYLEIGVWAGSTLCSAIDRNTVTALAIDNWSEFGGPSQQFFTNLARFKHPKAGVSFLERDFRGVDYQSIGHFNVYLFDGPHSAKDQRDGVVLPLTALDEQFVLIVDDWNWLAVREGTSAGIKDASLIVDLQIEVRTSIDNTQPEVKNEHSDWHNGYCISVLSKNGK
jgi:hypothetical protein